MASGSTADSSTTSTSNARRAARPATGRATSRALWVPKPLTSSVARSPRPPRRPIALALGCRPSARAARSQASCTLSCRVPASSDVPPRLELTDATLPSLTPTITPPSTAAGRPPIRSRSSTEWASVPGRRISEMSSSAPARAAESPSRRALRRTNARAAAAGSRGRPSASQPPGLMSVCGVPWRRPAGAGAQRGDRAATPGGGRQGLRAGVPGDGLMVVLADDSRGRGAAGQAEAHDDGKSRTHALSAHHATPTSHTGSGRVDRLPE